VTLAAGAEPTAEELNQLFAAGTVIARGIRTTASSGVTAATDSGVLRLDDVPMTAGRLYKVTHQWLPTSGTTTDVAEVQCRFDTTGAQATTSNAILQNSAVRVRCDANSDARGWSTFYVPVVDLSFSVLLCLKRVSGSGTVTLAVSGTTRYTAMWIEDCGVDPTDTGVPV
jgi:hypothetical protein